VMVPGVAMPHARPEAGALEVGLSVIRLKNPVKFGNDGFDPVHLVFSLCALGSESHLELLQDLSCVLDDSELVEKSQTCQTKEELIELIITSYNENK
ncbi:MAG: PTS sugar transporter subunit IIA, partial [Turicibacter sp.]